MKRAAVLGSPIAHSLSPVLHRAAYAELGLDWSYEAVECDEQRLPDLLDGLDDSWAGLSLTMPLKRTVLPLLDAVSELAATVGAANTVVFGNGGRWGDNTDVGGLFDVLTGWGVHHATRAVVLGGGATACSVLAALHDLGAAEVVLVVRDTSRTVMARKVAESLGVRLTVRTFDDLPQLLPVPLLVSTLPTAAADRVVDLLAGKEGQARRDSQDSTDSTDSTDRVGSVDSAGSAGVVVDVCYEPWPTPLADAAGAAGYAVAGGFEVLLQQAARQVTFMTGRSDVPLDGMRAAGERVLTGRSP